MSNPNCVQTNTKRDCHLELGPDDETEIESEPVPVQSTSVSSNTICYQPDLMQKTLDSDPS